MAPKAVFAKRLYRMNCNNVEYSLGLSRDMWKFKAQIELIGINPYVFVPEDILHELLDKASKNKGPIPIKGKINGRPYKQTLVKYRGAWRLYINTTMLKNSPKRVGEKIELEIYYDPQKRTIKTPLLFQKSLNENKEAKAIFDSLTPSKRFEIVRYLANLKTEEALERNVTKAISFLLGRERFIGRDKP